MNRLTTITLAVLLLAPLAATLRRSETRRDDYDGPGPREASPSWCRRNATWPQRAADCAAGFSSRQNVHAAIRTSLLDWLLNAQHGPLSRMVPYGS